MKENTPKIISVNTPKSYEERLYSLIPISVKTYLIFEKQITNPLFNEEAKINAAKIIDSLYAKFDYNDFASLYAWRNYEKSRFQTKDKESEI